ncbi:MAG: 16S rRNA (uracil(1498)-N(3))-methyltransferase [Spirochaetaceae bacterium]|nr:16S rRNA (uracil(1498)-N(3))-methyltransferase [Spirochaetaceae bacterium]
MNIVLFLREEMEKPLPLKDDRAKHILKVLHKQTGDSFDAGIINGEAGRAEITAITDEGISFHFLPQSDGKPLYPITLIIGFPRPIQLKRLFRDVAGLGASRLCLCGTELGEKSYMDSNIVERGAAYAALVDGSAQAKSTHIPELQLFPSVKACLSELFPAKTCTGSSAALCTADTDIRVMLDNVKPESTLFGHMQKAIPKNVPTSAIMTYAAIGSERGWTDNERSLFAEAGFASCSMGIRVLRTETAATVAMSLILQSMGLL